MSSVGSLQRTIASAVWAGSRRDRRVIKLHDGFHAAQCAQRFIVVARRLSHPAAARDLGVSTSALSQSVRQLEGAARSHAAHAHLAERRTGRRWPPPARRCAPARVRHAARSVSPAHAAAVGQARRLTPSEPLEMASAQEVSADFIRRPSARPRIAVDTRREVSPSSAERRG